MGTLIVLMVVLVGQIVRRYRAKARGEFRGMDLTITSMPTPDPVKFKPVKAQLAGSVPRHHLPLIRQLLGYLQANPDAYCGDGHGTTLLEHHLGGIVSHGALDVAAFQSSGVPGLIIELLRYARRRRRLVLQRGVWLLDGLDIDYDQRARDLVSSDLSRYTDEQREALELVVLAGEVEVELMLAAGLGEAADSLVAAGVLDLGGRGRPIYTCIESYSTETVRNTVPVGRSRQMFALVESHPGTPSKRARMLRADWALSCGAKVSVADSVEAARVARARAASPALRTAPRPAKSRARCGRRLRA